MDHRRTSLVACPIATSDIEFVREGQRVRVKVETYPFTRYGLLEGEVQSISADASHSPTEQSSEQPHTPQTSFKARVALSEQVL